MRHLPKTHLIAALLALSCTACTGFKASIMAGRITDGLYAIDGYQGRVSERGILRDAPQATVVKDVIYERMWKVRAEVREPEDHAGELFVFDGSTMSVWWPRYFFGLRIRGVKIPPREQVEEAIHESCLWTLENYHLVGEGQEHQAGRKVGRWYCPPRTGKTFRHPYRASMDSVYNVPLKVIVKDEPKARVWYGMAFDSIDFDAQVSDDAFAFEFPEGAIVYDWNLADPGVTLAEAQAVAEFPVLVPSKLPEGHEVRKVVTTRYDDMHMVALLMDKGARWLSLSQMPNMGPILVPELGIPVQVGDEEGVLNFALGFTTLSWSMEGTSLTLIGNLPYPEMLEIAASTKSAPETKK